MSAKDQYIVLGSRDGLAVAMGTGTGRTFKSEASAEKAVKRMDRKRGSSDWLVLRVLEEPAI